MHELSIAVSMVERILEESESRGGLQVKAVHLRLGALSGVDSDALAFSYEIACEGTSLAGSKLVIDAVPVMIYCESCSMECPVESVQLIACPHCRMPSERILRGRELEVAALEVAA
jgi:hydrogenase nickel incorporation protein HypA/HybF